MCTSGGHVIFVRGERKKEHLVDSTGTALATARQFSELNTRVDSQQVSRRIGSGPVPVTKVINVHD